MAMFIIKRLISTLITFFIVSVIIFMMMHAVPGGPFDGNDMPVSAAVKAKLNASLGLDKPLHLVEARGCQRQAIELVEL